LYKKLRDLSKNAWNARNNGRPFKFNESEIKEYIKLLGHEPSSDSLILNMLLHTKIDYIIILDFDMVYAAVVSAQEKWVVLPDNRIASLKNLLKGLQ
jgi:hypothetical protein